VGSVTGTEVARATGVVMEAATAQTMAARIVCMLVRPREGGEVRVVECPRSPASRSRLGTRHVNNSQSAQIRCGPGSPQS
jgi:hypothetical protein